MKSCSFLSFCLYYKNPKFLLSLNHREMPHHRNHWQHGEMKNFRLSGLCGRWLKTSGAGKVLGRVCMRICMCVKLFMLTCFAPIDSNIFSNRTLICWMLFISTQGWSEMDEGENRCEWTREHKRREKQRQVKSQGSHRKQKYKSKQMKVRQRKEKARQDDEKNKQKTKGQTEDKELQKWAAASTTWIQTTKSVRASKAQSLTINQRWAQSEPVTQQYSLSSPSHSRRGSSWPAGQSTAAALWWSSVEARSHTYGLV